MLLLRWWKVRQSFYSLDKNEEASLSKLQADGRITEGQAKAYKEYHAKRK